MEHEVLEGKFRDATGTAAVARLRREGWVPANLYGHGKANVNFQVRQDRLRRLLQEGQHVVVLEVDGETGAGLIKEVQFDTFGDHVIHVDLTRISLDEVVEVNIPIEVQGVPKGVGSGGVLDLAHHEVTVRGKAGLIPDSISVEIAHLEIGDSIRAGELELPEGVEVTLGADESVIIVHAPRGEDEPTDGESPDEPEVIGQDKPDGDS
ncbi:MAG: 50S ribosomal protein L25 [Planctomycetota bacterium]